MPFSFRKAWLVHTAVVFGLVATIPSAMAAGSAAPPGSYLQTCKGIHFAGDQLSAFCDDGSGKSYKSNLNIALCKKGTDIFNDYGDLGCIAPMRRAQGRAVPAGSYRASCSDFYVSGTILKGGICEASPHGTRPTLDLSLCNAHGDIANNHGQLICSPP